LLPLAADIRTVIRLDIPNWHGATGGRISFLCGKYIPPPYCPHSRVYFVVYFVRGDLEEGKGVQNTAATSVS
jgi:hypothetical protein